MRMHLRLGFGLTNLFTAAVLGGAVLALPMRIKLIDVPSLLIAVLLFASGVSLLANLRWALRLFTIATWALLAVGLLLIAIAVLTIAFLSGVHGHWVDAGLPATGLAIALLVPYTLLYPVVSLLWIYRQRGSVPIAASSGTSP